MAFKYEDIGNLSHIKKITLDTYGGTSLNVIEAKQWDKKTRYLEISVTRNGLFFPVDDSVTPRIRGTKPDGTSFLNDGCVKNGLVYIELTDQILAVAGRVHCDIGLYENESLLSTMTFYVDITRSAYDEEKIESSNEFSSITKVLSEADNLDISAIKEGKITTITVNKKDGTTQSVTVSDGTDGDKGDPFTYDDFTPEQLAALHGTDGYTPQKGVDYFTPEDILGLNIPSVDQTYSPNSENAQSGKAVAEAIATERNRADNTFANALKGSKIGSAILIDDISNVKHTVEIKIKSDTVTDLTSVKVSRCGKNLITFPYTYNGHTYGVGDTYTHNGITFTVNADRSITANGTAGNDATEALFNFFDAYNTYLANGDNPISVTLSGCPSGGSYNSYFLAQTNHWFADVGNGATFKTGEYTRGYGIAIKSGTTVENLVFKPQLELGAKATEYEPFITPVDYTPNSDGMVDGVESIYPNMSITSDTDGVLIDCEYNRDINKAFAELQQAIISLGGNV